MRRTPLQLAALFIGLALWGYSVRVNDDRLRWIGIGFLALGALLRFFRR